MNDRYKGYDFVRFLGTMMIVIAHFFRTCDSSGIKNSQIILRTVLNDRIGWGGIGVALFFLLSGAVHENKYRNHLNVKSFFKSRISRIEIPQVLGFLFAFLLTYIIDYSIIESQLFGSIISMFGLNYYGSPWQRIGVECPWLIGEWFTTVIIFCYIVFPILRYFYYRYKALATIGVVVAFIVNLYLKFGSSTDGWLSFSNAIMYFWIGMLFNEYKQYLTSKYVFSLCFMVMAAIMFIEPRAFFGCPYLVCFLFSICLFVALYVVGFSNNFIRYICKYNYEIYLLHHRIFLVFLPLLSTNLNNNMQVVISFFVLMIVVFGLAEFLHEISKPLINVFNKNLNE